MSSVTGASACVGCGNWSLNKVLLCSCVLGLHPAACSTRDTVCYCPRFTLLLLLSQWQHNEVLRDAALHQEYLKHVKSFQEVEAVRYGRMANCLRRSPAAC